MLKFLHLGALIATVVGTQVISSSLPSVSKDNVNTDVANATTSIFTADASNDTEVAQKVDPAWMLGLAALGGGAVAVVAARNALHPFNLSSIPSSFSPKFNPHDESTVRIEQASRPLRKKLLRLLHDETDTANRLISQAKLRNPNRSVDWCVEKVIYDLERDRGSY
jgi:hypothetical protein